MAELAKVQHGLITAGQLAALGHSRSTVSREARAGRLHRVHRGVYAVGHAAASRHGLCLAAVLAGGDGTVLSHSSAAWLWGLTPAWAARVEVTAPSPRLGLKSVRVHSSARLRDIDRVIADVIPTTAVPRTLLDFAAMRPRSIGGAVQRAERLGLLDLIAIDALLRCRRGTRGAARLKDALLPYREPAFTRSGLERTFLSLVKQAGLPRPSMNTFADGYELDAYWPAERFVVELDTYDYHGDRRSFESDRLRQEDLKLVGIEMVRVTGARLDREPKAVMARLSRLLAQRRQT